MSDLAASPRLRIALLDALRGVTIIAMIVFHFFFDLEFFGLGYFGVSEHWGWIAFARTIPATFLAISGISLKLAHAKGMNWRAFWWRLGYLVAAAALVTVISIFFDPEGIIWFGILHCIAASSLIGIAFLRRSPFVILPVAAIFLIGPYFATSAMNPPWLLWLGLGSQEPPSDDYNPLFPWFAFFLIGIALAQWIMPYAANASWARWKPANAPARLLTLAGRHSLIIYLLHQPILMAALFGIGRIAS